ncbi:MAG TPA: DUF1501 domain-containing protein [Pirellulaceae bacterium]|jgi:hypothetical protein
MLRFWEEVRLPSGRLNRRQWLGIGSLGALSLAKMNTGAANESAARVVGFGRAKSVILVFANGGQSQIDTWDPKPEAPLDVRGAFQPIGTAMSGVQFCEHMPRIAKIADRLTIVRSLSHEDLDHGTAAYLALTGMYHKQRSANPLPSPSDLPTYGAIVRRLQTKSKFVFDAIHVNGPALVPTNLSPGQDGGLLGRAFEPLVIGDPSDAAGALPDLAPRPELPPVRQDDRLTLKQSLDRYAARLEANQQALDMDRLYGQASRMLSSRATREAFDFTAEPAKIRERYGDNRTGQAMLLARRLVEAGVPYINVIATQSNRGQDKDPDDTDAYGWDTHNDIFDALQNRLLPRFDQSFAALIEDLDQRGLLDQTLVVCMGEFGRAPKVALEPRFAGASPGRKHWASVYSIAMAGAGVQRGAVVGASDRLGAEPVTDRYGPWDVAATMFHALGIDPRGHYTDTLNRPYAVAGGRVIEAVYS